MKVIAKSAFKGTYRSNTFTVIVWYDQVGIAY